MTRKEEIQKAAEEYYDEVKYLSDLSAFPIAAFKAGAEWADRTMLNRVCEWLKNHNNYQRVHDNGGAVRFDMTQCIFDLREYMEE